MRSAEAEARATVRVREAMAHRGPDGAGLRELRWTARSGQGRVGEAWLVHRRLAVVGLGAAGEQPMSSRDGRVTLVYNGELYNWREIAGTLDGPGGGAQRAAASLRASDTAALAEAIAAWGEAAIARLRGMYAFASIDEGRREVILARDPLGVKPLFYARVPAGGDGVERLVFASEPGALFEHGGVRCEPDAAVVSAYLTTIRTTLGERTLFEGVRCVRPGERIVLSMEDGREVRRASWWAERGGASVRVMGTFEEACERVREAVSGSVVAHAAADVPVCCLLSGGLDSSIVVTVLAGERGGASGATSMPALRTYCAGAVADGAAGDSTGGDDDFAHARSMASAAGSEHAEAVVDAAGFARRWGWMVGRTGWPLSTPNEVAIYEVAARLRADGMVVALSGEGADELFAGYAVPMERAWAWANGEAGVGMDGGMFAVADAAWVPMEMKGQVLSEPMWLAAEDDAALVGWHVGAFAEELARAQAMGVERDAVGIGVAAQLMMQRRVNLPGLLQRLDSASMLTGVEGRTPFADSEVATLAESMPMSWKLVTGAGGRVEETKRVLRRGFERALPASVVGRAKASFPLPFQSWMGPMAGTVLGGCGVSGGGGASDAARALFSGAAIDAVRSDAAGACMLAWPMLNLTLWAERWWGRGAGWVREAGERAALRAGDGPCGSTGVAAA